MMQQDRLRKSPKEVEFFTEYGASNRYKILEIIGKGSYGVVCAAIDTQTGEKVAIKKITNIFEHSSDAIRILREIKLLRLLRHPDIVDIKCILMPPSKRDFKALYVVFELMESDLHQVIKANNDLTHEHHRLFLYQMLRALKYMHTANVYHRDLKPKNILANANCKLKICDFGLARAAFTDTPTAVFWTDYVATRWYRAPELCGSFYSKVLEWIYSFLLEVEFSSLQYTPAVDIWGLGCIFAEVLTGKPLFPGKSVVHQLKLITDLLGTPSSDTISRVCNDKARKHLTNMPRKKAVSFSEKFLGVDPLALELLEHLLAFDPKDRLTAEQALADPYFKGVSKVEREPSCQPFSKMEFEFERRSVTKDDIRELIFREILVYHPKLLKDYIAGNDRSSFLYPSAMGQVRRQFSHYQENGRKSGTVIPLERKHVSLPRSAVSSSKTAPELQQCLVAFDNITMVDKVAHGATSNIFNSTPQPPLRKPKGTAAGPVPPLEGSENMKGAHDPRVMARNKSTVGLSPHYAYRSNNGDQACGRQRSTDRLSVSGLVSGSPCYRQAHGRQKSSELITIDATFVQAQSHREVGVVHMG